MKRVLLVLLVGACGGQAPVGDNEDAEVQPSPASTQGALVSPAPEAVEFPDMGAGEPVRVCGDDSEPSTCDECPAGYRCEGAFCGGEECVPGPPCAFDGDCASHRCIRPSDAPPTERGVCTTVDAGCMEDGDCSHGFQCESGSCIDRRIPCGFHERGCPRGHVCTFMPIEGQLFCVDAFIACRGDGQCEVGAHCIDVDGDGSRECAPAGSCGSNADCGEGLSCGVDPGTSQSACVVDGACRAGSCPEGFSCIDTGRGRRCAVRGSCERDAECPPQHICGAVSPSDPLRCLTFDEAQP